MRVPVRLTSPNIIQVFASLRIRKHPRPRIYLYIPYIYIRSRFGREVFQNRVGGGGETIGRTTVVYYRIHFRTQGRQRSYVGYKWNPDVFVGTFSKLLSRLSLFAFYCRPRAVRVVFFIAVVRYRT